MRSTYISWPVVVPSRQRGKRLSCEAVAYHHEIIQTVLILFVRFLRIRRDRPTDDAHTPKSAKPLHAPVLSRKAYRIVPRCIELDRLGDDLDSFLSCRRQTGPRMGGRRLTSRKLELLMTTWLASRIGSSVSWMPG